MTRAAQAAEAEDLNVKVSQQNPNGAERHFATLAISLILVSILWVGNTLVTQGNAQVKMAGAIDLMNSELTHLKELLRSNAYDKYTRSNADSDKATYDIRLQGLTKRVQDLEDFNKLSVKNWEK